MDIPGGGSLKKGLIYAGLRQGSVIRIKGDIPFCSNKYHVFIVLNHELDEDKINEAILLTVNGTTQYEKRLQYYRSHGIAADDAPIVLINGGKYNFFSRDTWIDCSDISRFEFSKIDTGDILALDGEYIDNKDMDKIIKLVLQSDLIAPIYKRMIDPTYRE